MHNCVSIHQQIPVCLLENCILKLFTSIFLHCHLPVPRFFSWTVAVVSQLVTLITLSPHSYKSVPFTAQVILFKYKVTSNIKSHHMIIISCYSPCKALQWLLIVTGIKSKFFVLANEALQDVASAYHCKFILSH